MKVLVFDHDPKSLADSATVLAMAGHACVMAKTLSECTQLMITENFDVFMMELYPVSTGDDTLAVVAAILARNPVSKVVILTTRCTARIAAKAMRAGVCDVILKPLSNEQLKKYIK
jgi:DNA-binding NtrC family response regulator